MSPARAVLVLGVVALTLSGCSESDEDLAAVTGSASASIAASAPATPVAPVSPGSPGSPAPASVPATQVPATTAAPATPAPTTAAVPSTSPPASPTASAAASAGLRSVRRDVASITPQLEAYYRNREYPQDLAQVRQTLSDTGVSLSAGNSIGGYTLDGDAVEFVLCVENTSGAWATYDTAPMTVARSGESGGCPG